MDIVVAPSGATMAFPGGPFNVARAVARLGGECQFLGRLSSDRFGRRLRSELDELAVDSNARYAELGETSEDAVLARRERLRQLPDCPQESAVLHEAHDMPVQALVARDDQPRVAPACSTSRGPSHSLSAPIRSRRARALPGLRGASSRYAFAAPLGASHRADRHLTTGFLERYSLKRCSDDSGGRTSHLPAI